MGKRSKARNAGNEEFNNQEIKSKTKILETVKPEVLVREKKKKINDVHIEEPVKVKKVKHGDIGVKEVVLEQQLKPPNNDVLVEKTKEKKVKKAKASKQLVKEDKDINKIVVKNNEKSKKIIFVDDEPHQVPASSGTTCNTGRDNKKKFLNDDEADVNNEDIDKFCDELSEEDNAQFEDWVKLIEANFHTNKKKST